MTNLKYLVTEAIKENFFREEFKIILNLMNYVYQLVLNLAERKTDIKMQKTLAQRSLRPARF